MNKLRAKCGALRDNLKEAAAKQEKSLVFMKQDSKDFNFNAAKKSEFDERMETAINQLRTDLQ